MCETCGCTNTLSQDELANALVGLAAAYTILPRTRVAARQAADLIRNLDEAVFRAAMDPDGTTLKCERDDCPTLRLKGDTVGAREFCPRPGCGKSIEGGEYVSKEYADAHPDTTYRSED